MNIEEHEHGFLIEAARFKIFLGKKTSQLDTLKKIFPRYHFSRIHQVHGNSIECKTEGNWQKTPQADAQWTELASTALCISTADCVPVFLYDTLQKKIAGIHAGWRGVAQRIVINTCQAFLKSGSQPENIYAVIGPHIQMPSFEVQDDAKVQIEGSVVNFLPEWIQKIGSHKYLIDLNNVVKAQLQEASIQPDHLFNLFIDTKTDPNFHSYRRDKEKSGRQISFIVQE